MVPSPTAATKRLRFLDAARGLTMFFVLLSHLAGVYFASPETVWWRWSLIRIGMIATPTFVILSGMLLGVHYQTARAGFGRIQAKLIDRGLFLILVSHAVIALPQGAWDNRILYSTDGLGVAMILGALLVSRMRGYSRLAVGVSAYVVSWLVIYCWHPAPGTTADTIVKEAMFGNLVPTALDRGTFPLVPWFAVYLISSVFGQRLAALYTGGSPRRLMAEVVFIGLGGVATAICIELVAWWFGVLDGPNNITSTLIWVGQKSPPAPLYLLLYCGAGLVLLGGCLVAERRRWFRRTFRYAVICGETSLFVYLAHFYLLWLGPHVLSPGGLSRGFAYFALSTAILVVAAQVWQRRALNRLFTVRYPGVYRCSGWLRLDTVPVMWLEQPR
jgi:uncharacterized membrane protein